MKYEKQGASWPTRLFFKKLLRLSIGWSAAAAAAAAAAAGSISQLPCSKQEKKKKNDSG